MKNNCAGLIKFIKTVGIAALCCTVALFAGLVVESSLPTEKSGALSDFFTEKVDSLVDVSGKIDDSLTTQKLAVNKSNLTHDYYFIGETVDLKLNFFPDKTRDTAVTYSVDDDSVAKVDENGKVTFVGMGIVKVAITLVSDNSINDGVRFWCAGENVLADDHPERFSFSFPKKDDAGNFVIKRGEKAAVKFNDGKTNVSIVELKSKDNSTVCVTDAGTYGLKAGDTEIIAVIERDGVKKTTFIPVTVIDEGYLPVTSLTFSSDVFIEAGKRVDYRKLFVREEDRPITDYDCALQTSDPSVVSVSSGGLEAVSPGEATITFTLAHDPALSVQKTVTVTRVPPTKLVIVGGDTITPNVTFAYEANHSPEKYEDCVTWSVVKGNATIDQEGNLTGFSFGEVVIRCQSTISEDLYAEKTIRVALFDSAYSFVRKFMGHMGLHALLGFGIAFTLLLLSKSKLVTLITPGLGFLTAVFTEVLQYFVPGRYCSWTDVLTDFFGSLFGFLAAVILTGLIILIWHFINRKSAKKLVKTLKTINYTNVFKKTEEIQTVILDELERQPENSALSEITAIEES